MFRIGSCTAWDSVDRWGVPRSWRDMNMIAAEVRKTIVKVDYLWQEFVEFQNSCGQELDGVKQRFSCKKRNIAATVQRFHLFRCCTCGGVDVLDSLPPNTHTHTHARDEAWFHLNGDNIKSKQPTKILKLHTRPLCTDWSLASRRRVVRPLLNTSQTVAQHSDVKCCCSARKFSMLRPAQLFV
jgi:hypothetical protein